MPKRDLETRIAELRARRDRVAAEIDRLRRRAGAEARKRDVRRKIVAGGAVLGAAAKSPKVDAWLRGLLDRTVARETDRALFDLGPKDEAEDETAPQRIAGEAVIRIEGRRVTVETPARSAGFAEAVKRLGGSWNAGAGRWSAPAEAAGEVEELARRCYRTVRAAKGS